MIHNHEVPGSIPGLATKNALQPKSIFFVFISLPISLLPFPCLRGMKIGS